MSDEQKTCTDNDAVNTTIYEQDCEFYRYHDNLKWSRFRTASLIEGAFLYALYVYNAKDFPDILILLCAGTVFVALLSFFAIRDSKRQKQFLDRIKKYEEKNPFVKKDGKKKKLKTEHLLLLSVFLLNAVNIFLVVRSVLTALQHSGAEPLVPLIP